MCIIYKAVTLFSDKCDKNGALLKPSSFGEIFSFYLFVVFVEDQDGIQRWKANGEGAEKNGDKGEGVSIFVVNIAK